MVLVFLYVLVLTGWVTPIFRMLRKFFEWGYFNKRGVILPSFVGPENF